MLSYPHINPVAFTLGPISIYWYGVMHLLAFLAVFGMLVRRGPTETPPWTTEAISDLVVYSAVGVILGGSLGNLLFYDIDTFFENPLKMFQFWEPGRSFHGGLLGVLIAIFIFSKVKRNPTRSFLSITDFIAPVVPIGLAAGRLGNFMNGELWGKITDVPWAIVFPRAGPYPRHPSQLYECVLEGLVLFIILNVYRNSDYHHKQEQSQGVLSGLFLIFYGLFRILVECLREPDFPIGYIAWGWVTMGQLLSVPMVIVGFFLFWHSRYICRSSLKQG